MNLSQQAAHLAHDHQFLGADHDDNARRTLWVVLLTVVMMAGEIVAGYLTGSMALLADGLHMATHAGALGIAELGVGHVLQSMGFDDLAHQAADGAPSGGHQVQGLAAVGPAFQGSLHSLDLAENAPDPLEQLIFLRMSV